MNNYKTQSEAIKVNGKIAGIVRGDLLDIRKHERHLLYTPPAVAIGLPVLEAAERMGVIDVRISIIETGQQYQTTLEHFRAKSFPVRRGGFEDQLGCVLSEFTASMSIDSQMLKAGESRYRKATRPRGHNTEALPMPRQLLFRF